VQPFAPPPHGAREVQDPDDLWRRVVRRPSDLDGRSVNPDVFTLSSADKDAEGQLSGRLASLIERDAILASEPSAVALCEISIAEIETVMNSGDRVLRCVDDSACDGRPPGHAYVDHSRLRPFGPGADARRTRGVVRMALATFANQRGLHFP
jgi:hypothetical protein